MGLSNAAKERRRIRRGCQNRYTGRPKMRYATEAAALKALEHDGWRGLPGAKEKHVFLCENCTLWHIGSLRSQSDKKPPIGWGPGLLKPHEVRQEQEQEQEQEQRVEDQQEQGEEELPKRQPVRRLGGCINFHTKKPRGKFQTRDQALYQLNKGINSGFFLPFRLEVFLCAHCDFWHFGNPKYMQEIGTVEPERMLTEQSGV